MMWKFCLAVALLPRCANGSNDFDMYSSLEYQYRSQGVIAAKLSNLNRFVEINASFIDNVIHRAFAI